MLSFKSTGHFLYCLEASKDLCEVLLCCRPGSEPLVVFGPSTHYPQCPWHWLLIPEDTKVCWPQSEKGPVGLCVCSVAVWEYMGSAGSNAKVQHGQRLFRAAIFSQLQLTFAQPAIPLQACLSDFWVRKTTTATWKWISAPRCEEGSQASDVPLLC